DLDTLPLDDAKTYALLSEAKTFGVFQLESSGMREALRGLRPERLADVIAMVSLYRPGPMELIPDFIERRHGRAKITYEHPAMEIRVEPPDVNVSAVRFSVAGDTVRFGLAAIRNVGEAAMESILRARAEAGPFTSLEDFCARVDLRLVNRRVLESLIKAGAFDSLGLSRAHLLATADAALEGGQRKQRDRAEGQASFFDLLPAGAPAPSAAATETTPEWEPDQRLAFEKEVLGFYVSGHPLARFRSVVESLGLTTTAELAAKGHAARVLLFGHAAGLKETSTKSGNRMAFFTLEDMDGTVEVTVFPEPYRAAAACLHSREPLL